MSAVLLLATAGASCSGRDPAVANEHDAVSQLERRQIDEVRTSVILQCMAEAGFDVSKAELEQPGVPARFDGQSYLFRLLGDPSAEVVAIDVEEAVTIAADARRGVFNRDHSCSDFSELVAAIQVLGPERADLVIGSSAPPDDFLSRLLADPQVVAADSTWRSCLKSMGLESSSYSTIDDLGNRIDELEQTVLSTDPAVRAAPGYASARGLLPVLRAASKSCDPAFAEVIKERAADLDGSR